MNPFETLRAIRDLPAASAIHKAILYAMALRTDGGTGACWPSYPRLALDAGVSLAVAKRAVRELERAGHITVTRSRASGTQWSQVNRYVVHVRHDPVSQRDDLASRAHHEVRGANGVPEQDIQVHKQEGRGPDEGDVEAVAHRDDPVRTGHDVVHERQEVVSARHDLVPQRDEVGAARHDSGVLARPRVVSLRDEGRVAPTPDLPLELPKGRSFSLAVQPEVGAGRSSSKRPKHTPELIDAKNAVVAEFVACCEATKGFTPKKIHERDHAAAFALAKTYGVAEARSILRRAFDDDFVRTKNTTLAFIESKAETYRGGAVKKATGRRELQALTGDEPWLKEHQK